MFNDTSKITNKLNESINLFKINNNEQKNNNVKRL